MKDEKPATGFIRSIAMDSSFQGKGPLTRRRTSGTLSPRRGL
jgi:hypothetical protein